MALIQEEVNHKTVGIIITGGKISGRILAKALKKYMEHRKNKKNLKKHQKANPRGKQTVEQLMNQDAGASNIEITNKNIRGFEKVARKYHVDYALRKDRSKTPPQYIVLFKSRDEGAMNLAFKEYVSKTMKVSKKPSLIQKLDIFKKKAAQYQNKDKHRSQEKSR